MGKISVKWVKSGIGRPYDQRRTLESLGLKKLNQTKKATKSLHLKH